jgi:hypothetical protein
MLAEWSFFRQCQKLPLDAPGLFAETKPKREFPKWEQNCDPSLSLG